MASGQSNNRMISATSLEQTNGAVRVLSAYDHQHRRVRKTVKRLSLPDAAPPAPPPLGEWATTETHTYVWDGNNIALETIASSNGTTRACEYFWGPDLSGTEQGAGGVGGLLAVSIDGAFFIPCYDHNGNIVRYISEDGDFAAAYEYDPFGNVLSATGPLADVFTFGFSTKPLDRETGLVSYQRRFYRPPLGRFLNRDPIEEAGGENLYAFCANSPVIFTDFLGFVTATITMDTAVHLSDKFGVPHKFLDISVSIMGALKPNESVNFVQLVRKQNTNWEIDNSGRPTPFYYDRIDLKKRTMKDVSGFDILTFSDSPSGSIQNELSFYVAVVLVTTECHIGNTRFPWEKPFPAIVCASKVKVIAEREWSFSTSIPQGFRFDNSSQPRAHMKTILKSLIEQRKWQIDNLCDGTITIE